MKNVEEAAIAQILTRQGVEREPQKISLGARILVAERSSGGSERSFSKGTGRKIESKARITVQGRIGGHGLKLRRGVKEKGKDRSGCTIGERVLYQFSYKRRVEERSLKTHYLR